MAGTDPDRAVRLATAAEEAAHAITDELEKPMALAIIAEAVVGTDPDRAVRLATAAEEAAHAITDESWKARVPASIAETAADYSKALALAIIVKAVVGTDPDRAVRLATAAEEAAPAITGAGSDGISLFIWEAAAAADPDHAERIAQAITDESLKASALARVAKAVAGTDPDRAVRLIASAEEAAHAIPDESSKARALAGVAEAVAGTDPDRAA